MAAQPPDIPTGAIIEALADSPARLSAITAGLQSAQLRRSPAENEWSATELLAHLRSCCDVWGDCITSMLETDYPTIKAVNPRSWVKKTNYADLEFRTSLDAFAAQRADLVGLLNSLTESQWTRAATVTGAGSPLQRTVFDYALRLKRHERAHLPQMAAIVASLDLRTPRIG